MSASAIQKILEALEHDSLPSLKRILQEEAPDLNTEVLIGSEYELDEPDEIPLLFYAIMKHASIEAIRMLVEAGMDLEYRTREGLGALDIAIKHRRYDVVQLCKEHGISLTESRRKSGLTPLMLAAGFNDLEMVKYLIAEGAEVNAVDRYGMSALDYARKMGQNRMKEYLESIGARYNAYGNERSRTDNG